MKKLVTLVIGMLISAISYGQYNAYNVNSPASGSINGIASDTGGNLIFSGGFSNSITLGSVTLTNTMTPYGHLGTSYLAKMTPGGAITWAKAIKLFSISGANSSSISINDVETDAAGNIYICGTYYGKVGFDNITLSSAKNGPDHTFDWYTAKLSAAGNFIWARSEGGNENSFGEQAGALAVDAQANVYVTGRLVQKVFKNANICTLQGRNTIIPNTVIPAISLIKYNSAGTKLYEKKFYNSLATANSCASPEAGADVVLSGSSIYLTGMMRGTVSFGSVSLNTGSVNTSRAFITKLDLNGNVLWADMAGGGSFNIAYAVGDGLFVDQGNNVYMRGVFYDTLQFDAVTITTPTASGYLAKFNSGGTCQWIRRLASICYGMADLPNGNLAVLARHGDTYSIREMDPASGSTVDSVMPAPATDTVPKIVHWSGLAQTPDGYAFTEQMSGNYDLGGQTITGDGLMVIRYTNPALLNRRPLSVFGAKQTSSEIFIYPNPVHDRLNVESPSNESLGQLKVYDVSGRVVYSELVQGTRVSINIKDMAAGVYYLKNDRSAVIRFVRQ